MAYIKNTYDNRNIADISREALEQIEEALRVGYHAVVVGACANILSMLDFWYLALLEHDWGWYPVVFWPFFEGEGHMSQDFGRNGYHFYTSAALGCGKDLDAWDTPPVMQGAMRAYRFNGEDEWLAALDQDNFSAEGGTFSLGAWVNMVDATASCILSKWDETDSAEKREWKLGLGTTGYPGFTIYDETNNAAIGREDQTALSENEWHFIVATCDGGADAANVGVWVDGVQTDDADIADDVGFVGDVNQTTKVRCGSFEDDGGDEADLFDGYMWGPFYTHKLLFGNDIWNLYQMGKALLDLDLIGGQPK